MAVPAISVVIANWRRRDSLLLALRSLELQSVTDFEVVVASDVPAPPEGYAARVGWVQVREPNVSAARNAAIALARAPLLAFLDDDAVAEPFWIEGLMAAFAEPSVAAAGGPVMARDGVSVQWGRAWFDRDGAETEERPGAVLKLNGTNLALRRSALDRIGGFDRRFAYFLDETDVLLRLSDAGHDSRWVEDACVVHGYRESPLRDARAVPHDLRPLGRSKAAFCARHSGGLRPEVAAAFSRAQRRRLLGFHRIGLLDGAAVLRLMAGLEDELAKGCAGDAAPPAPARDVAGRGAPGRFGARVPQMSIAILAGPAMSATAHREAARLARAGALATVIELGWLARRVRGDFTGNGYWRHRGGAMLAAAPRRWREVAARELSRLGPRRRFTCIARCEGGAFRVFPVWPDTPDADGYSEILRAPGRKTGSLGEVLQFSSPGGGDF